MHKSQVWRAISATLVGAIAILAFGCDGKAPTAPANSGAAAKPPQPKTVTSVDYGRLTMNARNLTPQQVQQMESQLEADPDQLAIRAQLVVCYFGSGSEDEIKRQQHALWIIEHHPECDIAGTPEASIDHISHPEAYERASQLWLTHCEAHPNDSAILSNAADFLFHAEPAKAQDLIERCQKIEPDNPKWSERLGQMLSMEVKFNRGQSDTATRALDAYEKALANTTGMKRYYMLADVAKAALDAESPEKARAYAQELLDTSVQVGHDWNFGNAVHHGNLILGRIALAEGNVEKAEEYLLQAGRTPGSPQLNSFGPNMTLAQELLKAGRKDAVIQYLDLCGKFWSLSRGRLDQWKEDIADGRTPAFGTNLVY